MAERQEHLPARIGPFEIIGVIGKGGMGVVYSARLPGSSDRVAVKTVAVAQEGLLSSMRREIHALGRLVHPGVVRVLSSGVDDGRPWYAMELLEGTTLAALRDLLWTSAAPPLIALGTPGEHDHTQTMPMARPPGGELVGAVSSVPCELAGGRLARVLTVMRRLLTTLAYVHGEGIVHRDIKPQNVFLRDGDQLVLVDFGVASRSAGIMGREVLDLALDVAGTPAYMAPEQICGDPVDSRADLYAVGCVFHELLTGRPPFIGNMALVMHHHLQMARRPPSELVTGCPRELDQLVLALLEKRPRDRIGHAEDVIYALDELGAEPEPRRPRRPRAYVYRPALAGREAAMDLLDRAALAASRGEGGCVLIAGESGVGKTYLAMEAARATREFQIVSGTCALVGTFHHGPGGQPLHPFARLFQLVTDRCTALGRTATDHLLGARGKILDEHEPGLARLPGQDAYPDPPPLHGAARRDRLLTALADTLAALAEEQPLLLVLDDLQWADDVSLRFLTSLGDDWFRGKRVLVIGTYRVEEATPDLGELLGRPYTRRIDLGNLDEASVGSVVSDMLAVDAPSALVRFLTEHSKGNPFFVAEYLRAATAEGLLRRGGHKRLRIGRSSAGHDPKPTDLAELALPLTMPELVGRRLDGLTPVARNLARYASVIGREFDSEILRDAAGASEAEALDGVAELIARQVLEPTDAGALRFVHDKLCEITYERQDPAIRMAMHREIAEAIGRRAADTDTVPRFHAALAHHYLAAGARDKAIEYLEKAGERALAVGAYAEAADLHRKLLAIDEGRAGAARGRARWKHGLAKAYFALGDLEHAETHARAALADLGVLLPDAKGGWTKLLLVEALRRTWRMLGPQRTPEQPSEACREDLAEAAQLAELVTHRYYYVGDAVSMIGASLLSVNLAERGAAGPLVPGAYAWLGYALGLLRRHELARRHFDLAYSGTDRIGDVLGKAWVLNLEAVYHIGFGAFEAAGVRAARALELGETDAQMRELALNVLGHVTYYTGRLEDSQRHIVLMLASAKKRANHQHTTWCLMTRARAMAAQGRAADSLPLLREARARLAERPELDSEIITLGLLAAAEAATGDARAARAAARGTLERVRRSKPAGFSVIDGYDGAATALIALVRRHGADAELEAGTRELVAAMRRLALLFPMAGPYASLHRGELERLRGRTRYAKEAFARACDLAGAMGMRGLRARAVIALEKMPA
jgi:eukaryotic-like serine/threonine-protein kinase